MMAMAVLGTRTVPKAVEVTNALAQQQYLAAAVASRQSK